MLVEFKAVAQPKLIVVKGCPSPLKFSVFSSILAKPQFPSEMSTLATTLHSICGRRGHCSMGHTSGRGKSATAPPPFLKVNFSQSLVKQSGAGTDIVVMGGAVMT